MLTMCEEVRILNFGFDMLLSDRLKIMDMCYTQYTNEIVLIV